MNFRINVVLQSVIRQTQDARQATNERFYGVGSGSETETGWPVPTAAQRRAEQDTGETVEVSTVWQDIETGW